MFILSRIAEVTQQSLIETEASVSYLSAAYLQKYNCNNPFIGCAKYHPMIIGRPGSSAVASGNILNTGGASQQVRCFCSKSGRYPKQTQH